MFKLNIKLNDLYYINYLLYQFFFKEIDKYFKIFFNFSSINFVALLLYTVILILILNNMKKYNKYMLANHSLYKIIFVKSKKVL